MTKSKLVLASFLLAAVLMSGADVYAKEDRSAELGPNFKTEKAPAANQGDAAAFPLEKASKPKPAGGVKSVKRTAVIKGEIGMIDAGGGLFIIIQNGRAIEVKITDKTVIVRRFFGRGNLNTLSVGDRLQVQGRLEAARDQAGNEIRRMEARLIRDMSTWKVALRQHPGTVKEINTAEKSFILLRSEKEKVRVITVKTSAATKFLLTEKSKGKRPLATAYSFDKLVLGDGVRLSGIFNKNTNVLDADTVIVVNRAEAVGFNPQPHPSTAPTST